MNRVNAVIAMIGLRVLCGFMFLVRVCAAQDETDKSATITGWVVDAGGTPIDGAIVQLYDPYAPAKGRQQTQDSATTNANGFFEVTGVPPGTHFLIAKKESAGFGDLRAAFFAVGSPPPLKITAAPGQGLGRFRINLGHPHGRLVCHVTDAVDGKGIAVRYRLITANPETFFSSNSTLDGRFEKPVPSVPITLEVFAPGYRSLAVPGIVVGDGESKELDVELAPLASKPE